MKCLKCKKYIWPWQTYAVHMPKSLIDKFNAGIYNKTRVVTHGFFDRKFYIKEYLSRDSASWHEAGFIHYKCRKSNPARSFIEKPPKEWPIRKTPRRIPPRSKDYEDFFDDVMPMSGLVTIPQFSKIVDLLKCAHNDVARRDLEAVLSNEDIRTYVRFGYLKITNANRYYLTPKGRMAYYQNLDFRAQVAEAKKKIEKELSLDTPPSKNRGKYVASPFATEPDPRKFAVKSKLVEEVGVIKKDDGEKLVAVSGKNTDIVELTYLADALMETGVDPIALLRDKLRQAKNLKRYRYEG